MRSARVARLTVSGCNYACTIAIPTDPKMPLSFDRGIFENMEVPSA